MLTNDNNATRKEASAIIAAVCMRNQEKATRSGKKLVKHENEISGPLTNVRCHCSAGGFFCQSTKRDALHPYVADPYVAAVTHPTRSPYSWCYR